MSGENTSVNKIIEFLKKYSFEYYFSRQELSEKGFNNLTINYPSCPIYFATGKNEDMISVMAFGGCIGWISFSNRKKYLNKEEKSKISEFVKYLSPKDPNDEWYINEHGHSICLPKKFAYESEYQKNGCQIMEKLLVKEEFSGKISCNQILYNKTYLDLMVCAAYVRYMHRKLDENKGGSAKSERETILLDASERSIQTVIARKSIDDCNGQDMFVIDIEFKEQIRLERGKIKNPSVDFVVLDKKAKKFGLIEFKYQGKSMNPRGEKNGGEEGKEENGKEESNGDNSLTTHFEDFMVLIQSKHKEIVKRLVKHTSRLVEYNIIHDFEVKDILEEISRKEEAEDALWCGFYFVDDKENGEKITSRNNISMTMNERICYDCYVQVVKEYDNNKGKYGIDLKDIRFQHSDVADPDYWKLTMDENFGEKKFEEEIRELLEN